MTALVKPDEVLPSTIRIEQTDLHFPGDCKIYFEVPEERMEFAPTGAEIAHAALLIGRNDSHNPRYRWGKNYIFQYLSMIFRDDHLYYEPNIRTELLEELYQNDKITKLIELEQELQA